MKYLVIVESPFQLLQAYELGERGSNVKYFVRLNDSQSNNKQLTKLVDLLSIKDVTYFKVSSMMLLARIFLSVIYNVAYNRLIVFGDDNSKLFKVLKLFIPSKLTLLLDDGVATLNSKSNYARFTIFKNVKGKRNYLSKTLEFNRTNTCDLEPVNVIVGGDLVEVGICSADTYYETLNEICDWFSENQLPIIYIAHRGEEQSSLERIACKFNFKVIETDFPIEFIQFEHKVSPVLIASTISTAVYTLDLIYPKSEIRVFPISDEKILDRKGNILKIYENMKKHSHFLNYK